jgi:hypothetical protein
MTLTSAGTGSSRDEPNKMEDQMERTTFLRRFC